MVRLVVRAAQPLQVIWNRVVLTYLPTVRDVSSTSKPRAELSHWVVLQTFGWAFPMRSQV
jgi:hypothetical protein